MLNLATGPTPDAILSTTSSLLLGFFSTTVAVVIAFFQSRSKKAEFAEATAAWREQAEELSERMERQNAAELARLVQQLHDRDRVIAEKDSIIARLQRRNGTFGDASG